MSTSTPKSAVTRSHSEKISCSTHPHLYDMYDCLTSSFFSSTHCLQSEPWFIRLRGEHEVGHECRCPHPSGPLIAGKPRTINTDITDASLLGLHLVVMAYPHSRAGWLTELSCRSSSQGWGPQLGLTRVPALVPSKTFRVCGKGSVLNSDIAGSVLCVFSKYQLA